MSSLLHRVEKERLSARVPLFVIGSGVSRGIVPSLADMVAWLYDTSKPHLTECPSLAWISPHAERLVEGQGSRREASEFFSAMQIDRKPLNKVWDSFAKAFLLGELEINGKQFRGMLNSLTVPSLTHRLFARLLRENQTWVLSVNFDGLTHLALTANGQPGLVLHTLDDVLGYFTADTDESAPAVIKVRGDVFQALCNRPSCPQARQSFPLERLGTRERLTCPLCGTGRLRLQLSLPGFRTKEEEAEPVLWAVRRFLGARVSAIVMVGFSGRWDDHLLRFLFDWALERRLAVADVKPGNDDTDSLIDRYRASYYPSVRPADGSSAGRPHEAVFFRIRLSHEEFSAMLESHYGGAQE